MLYVEKNWRKVEKVEIIHNAGLKKLYLSSFLYMWITFVETVERPLVCNINKKVLSGLVYPINKPVALFLI